MKESTAINPTKTTLTRLLSKPDNWNINVNYLVKTGKQGRTAVRLSIAELESAGYIHGKLSGTGPEGSPELSMLFMNPRTRYHRNKETQMGTL